MMRKSTMLRSRIVDLLHLVDAGDVDLVGALRLLDAPEGEHHVVGGEGRAVVELDALPEVEAPLRVGDLFPVRRQRRLDLVVLGVAGEALVGVLQDRVRGGVVLRVRVERQDVVLRRPLERHRLRRQAHRYEYREQKLLHSTLL
jgi:hypothetical protein